MSWIVSRRVDLVWFHGAVLAGVALLAFFALAPRLDGTSYAIAHPAVVALFLWGVVFDGTHVFGTYLRSYLAPDAARARLPGGASIALVFVGPLIALVDHLVCTPVPSLLSHAGWMFRAFLLFAYLWAYYHLVRQHYGFLALYRRRAHAVDERERKLETLLLWVGTLYPFLRFSLSPAYARSGLPVLLPSVALPALRVTLDLSAAVFGGLLVAALARRTRSLGPRHLLLAIVIAFHWLVFAVLDNLLAITATLTIFHNLQYHRIVWQHELDHGRVPSLWGYLAVGLVLGVAWYGPRVLGVATTHDDLVRNLLLGLGWGIAFHHYYVDGRIWRRRA
jgi:hypothetical protein